MLVSIVILNWNKTQDTCTAIDSCMQQDYKDLEIIVVDNGSNKPPNEIIEKKYPNVRIITLDKNIGCPPGRNVGVRAARGELLFFLDDDGAYHDKDLISGTVTVFTNNPNIGALYFKVIDPNTGCPERPLDRSLEYVDDVHLSSSFRGGAAVIRRSVFERVGYYPEDFFRQGEERYISLKIYESGYCVMYYPYYAMIHKGSMYLGKNRIVAKMRMQNELKTILRLYPKHLMILYILVKLITHIRPMYSSKAWLDYIRVILALPIWILSQRNRSERVSASTVLFVERIRYCRIVEGLSIEKLKRENFAVWKVWVAKFWKIFER